jgi:hypothetical protein
MEIVESVINHCARGFGGIALAPERKGEPITDLRRLFGALGNSAGAEHGGVTPSDEKYRLAGACVRSTNKTLRIRERIRVQNAHCIFRNSAIVEERSDRFRILQTGPRNTSRSVAMNGIRRSWSVSDEVRSNVIARASSNRRGETESRLPSWYPVWVRRFDGIRQTSMKSTVYSAAASVIG